MSRSPATSRDLDCSGLTGGRSPNLQLVLKLLRQILQVSGDSFWGQSVLWRRFYWYIEFKVIREKLKYDAGEPCWQPTKASSANRSIGGFSEFCRLFLNSFVTASDSPGSMWYQDVSGTWLRVNQLPLGFSYLTIRFWEESAKDATDAVLLAEIPGRGKGYLAKRKIKRGEASPVEWVTGCHCSSELDPDIWILSKSF